MWVSSTSATTSGRPWKHAALWLVGLGPFFFLSYGFATWFTSQRTFVGSLVFDWEQRIPFLSWTIVPYWSIDLLYALSLFVCATQSEVNVHGRRLLGAQLICVTCFLLFPLQFTFIRPATDGVFGLMFEVLMGFDKPFNQAPSLHIALLVILWVQYARHLQGAWRWVLHFWFALIGISVLTTYQHHFVDVPTGLWVGGICLWMFPDAKRSTFTGATLSSNRTRRKLAVRYGAAALLLAIAAAYLSGWALWLFWGVGSLALIAVIYAFLGADAFQKAADGSMSKVAGWLLAPYLLGAWINSRYWTHSIANADEIVPGVLLGRLPTRKERDAQCVHGLIDLTAELPCDTSGLLRYANISQLDLVPPTVEQINRSVRAIESCRTVGRVLVACALGFSRSATAVAAWLLATGQAQCPNEAIEKICRARPSVVLSAAHRRALEKYFDELRETPVKAV